MDQPITDEAIEQALTRHGLPLQKLSSGLFAWDGWLILANRGEGAEVRARTGKRWRREGRYRQLARAIAKVAEWVDREWRMNKRDQCRCSECPPCARRLAIKALAETKSRCEGTMP